MNRHASFAGTAMAVAAIAVAACTNHATPATSTTPATPGGQESHPTRIPSTLTVIDSNIGAEWTVTVRSITLYQPSKFDTSVPAGTHDVVINVTYHAIKGSVGANPVDWESASPNGQTLPAVATSQSGALNAAQIKANSSITGNVILQVSNTSSSNVAVYSFGLVEKGSWTIPGDAG